jgi:hypothetical protein
MLCLKLDLSEVERVNGYQGVCYQGIASLERSSLSGERLEGNNEWSLAHIAVGRSDPTLLEICLLLTTFHF